MSRSGRPSLVGIFHAVTTRSFPTTTKPFSAWMHLNQGNAFVRMRLLIERRLPDVLDCETILAVPFTLHFADPNEIHEHAIDFGSGIDLPTQGCYQARLAADDDTILTHPFVATYGPGE